MSLFKIGNLLQIREIEEKPKTVTKVYEVKSYGVTHEIKEEIKGTITTPKKINGRVVNVLERNFLGRKETEYGIKEILASGEEASRVTYYKESYLSRYARLLT